MVFVQESGQELVAPAFLTAALGSMGSRTVADIKLRNLEIIKQVHISQESLDINEPVFVIY